MMTPQSSAPDLNASLDGLAEDRLELLSAYLDGEVTTAERHQVEGWLRQDPAVKTLYLELQGLRQGLREMPMAAFPLTSEQRADKVLAQIKWRQMRQVWGGMAIAAAFAAAVTTAIPRQMPQGGADATTPEVLLIALDQPVVDLSLAPSQKNLN